MTVATETRLEYDPKTSRGGPDMKESTAGAEEEIEQRLWELALDSPLEEVARALKNAKNIHVVSQKRGSRGVQATGWQGVQLREKEEEKEIDMEV